MISQNFSVMIRGTDAEIAIKSAIAALERVRPQAKGVLVVMDIDEAIVGLKEILTPGYQLSSFERARRTLSVTSK
jgi:hypothetical protein